jgi:hypothetical protein
MIVPAYGPNWRSKVSKMSLFLWHIKAIHDPIFRTIRRAPWNAKPRRKRIVSQSTIKRSARRHPQRCLCRCTCGSNAQEAKRS